MTMPIMNEEQIFERILALLKEEIKIKGEISQETALLKEGCLDSMDFLKYLTRIEEIFHLKIDDAELESHQLGILSNMISFIKNRPHERRIIET